MPFWDLCELFDNRMLIMFCSELSTPFYSRYLLKNLLTWFECHCSGYISLNWCFFVVSFLAQIKSAYLYICCTCVLSHALRVQVQSHNMHMVHFKGIGRFYKHNISNCVHSCSISSEYKFDRQLYVRSALV